MKAVVFEAACVTLVRDLFERQIAFNRVLGFRVDEVLPGYVLAHIDMQGQQSEHEDERGRIKLYDHEFNRALDIAEVYDVPFRELWMRQGVQTFDPLVQLEIA